ncbi:MAG: CoA-binding protein [SAR324 cluster bacterium]|nr:CoA-binding protein [SAR324 cluster bacterium]
MNKFNYSDEYIRSILEDAKIIAMVGCSANSNRPSHSVMQYLIRKGHRVIPVNPVYAGQEILGQTVYSSLADVPGSVDMVDFFLRSEAVGPIVDMAIELAETKKISVIWMQLGVSDENAAKRAEEANIRVVMDRCPVIEYGRMG